MRVASVALLASCCLSAPVKGAPIAVRLSPGAGVLPPAVTLVAVPIVPPTFAGKPPSTLRQPSASPAGPHLLDLDSNLPWKIHIEAPGSWAGERLVNPSLWPSSLALELWPAAGLGGRLSPPPNEAPPQEVDVRFRAPVVGRTRATEPLSRILCPVREGRFRCEVPVGLVDLSVRVPGFVPHYLPDAVFTAGKDRELGTLELARGASVAGWVTAAEGQLDPEHCEVTLKPLVHPGIAPTSVRKMGDRALTARPTAKGFFQLGPIPPGSYILQASQPGRTSAAIFPLAIHEQLQVELREPLVLEPPLTLEVHVAPPLGPTGRPWRIELLRHSVPDGRPEPAGTALVQANGEVTIKGLPPALYAVQVHEAGGEVFAAQEVLLRSENDVLSFEIPLVWVEGKVSLGGEPLAAALWFGGRKGTPRQRLVADDEGRFAGVLPREGSYRVDLEAEDPPLRRRLRVAVDAAGEERRAEVDIELPNAALAGLVLDEGETPVAGALVRLLAATQALTTRTDGLGNFRFGGLAEGEVAVSAEHEGRSSALAFATVSERRLGDPVELRLAPEGTIQGRMRTAGGALPGATVFAFPVVGGLVQPLAQQAITDADGSFELRLPAAATEVQILAMPIGFSLIAGRYPLAPRQGIELVASRGGGEVTANLGRPLESEAGAAQPALVVNGQAIDLRLLRQWAYLNGRMWDDGTTAITVPALPAASYQLCEMAGLAEDLRGSLSADQPALSRCVEGYLPDGGELVLGAPPRPK